MMQVLRIILSGLSVLSASLAYGQSYVNIEKNSDEFKRAYKFSGDTISEKIGSITLDVNWIKNEDYSYYFIKAGGEKRYYLVDSKKGKTVNIFNLPDSIACYIGDFNKKDSDLLECRKGGKDYYFSIKRKSFMVRPKDTTKVKGVFSSSKEYWKKFCTDSSYYIYGKSDNLYLSKCNEGRGKQMTQDGEPFFSFTTFKSPDRDTINKSVRGDWFKDSHIAYFLRPDYRKVTTMTVINSLAPVPVAKTYKFELTNDKNVTQYELLLLYADSAKTVKADISCFKDQEVKFVKNFNRSVDYEAIYFTRRNRTCDTLQLCELNPYNASVRVLIEEIQKPIVNELLQTVAILNGGEDIIWWSEREGYGAYYLYDRNGKLKNKIAGGDFVAGGISSIDTTARKIIFEGYGFYKDRDPYHKYYFTAGLDGKNFKCLTPSDGSHELSFSSSKKYFIDTYSSVDKFPRKELRTINGSKILEYPQSDSTKLLDYGWVKPIAVKLMAKDDSTKLYGVMYTPSDMKNGQKYPIICNMYPGPQTDLVPRTFFYDDNDNSSLSQMGFIVINIGLRGSSPYRGPAFYGFSHGNLRDYAVEDVKYCVEQLAAKYQFIDINKVGIYGHSGGGFLTATAMLTYPDFFKVGVSVSGNHDNNIYAKFWGEVYNGYGPKIATNMELASKLEGKLLLITGDVDDNVHPANTLRMVDALIKNDKRFDMFIMPGFDHGMYGKYYTKLIRHYFMQYLR